MSISEYKEIISNSPAHGAVMDNDGVIVAVNESWIQFGKDNNLTDEQFSVGTSYLKVCVTKDDDNYAKRAERHLSNVMNGHSVTSAFLYPCHSPTEERWFLCKFYKIPEGILTLHFRQK